MFLMVNKEKSCYKTVNTPAKKEYLEGLGFTEVKTPAVDETEVKTPAVDETAKKEPKKAEKKKSDKTDKE